MVELFAAIVTDGVINGFTVITIGEEVKTAGVAQVALLVISNEYDALLTAVVVEYVAFVAPEIYALPNFHLYKVEEPSFVATEVKVTLAPVQIVSTDGAIVTVGVTVGLTVITNGRDVTIVGLAQAALLVNVTVYESLLEIAFVV